MRLTSASGARPEWYDRNPGTQYQFVITASGPHSLTTRWTYTVPSGRKAWLASYSLLARRTTAATTPGIFEATIAYAPNLGAFGAYDQAASTVNTTPDAGVYARLSNVMNMVAGDRLAGQDDDTSTGGQSSVTQTAQITEYDG